LEPSFYKEEARKHEEDSNVGYGVRVVIKWMCFASLDQTRSNSSKKIIRGHPSKGTH